LISFIFGSELDKAGSFVRRYSRISVNIFVLSLTEHSVLDRAELVHEFLKLLLSCFEPDVSDEQSWVLSFFFLLSLPAKFLFFGFLFFLFLDLFCILLQVLFSLILSLLLFLEVLVLLFPQIFWELGFFLFEMCVLDQLVDFVLVGFFWHGQLHSESPSLPLRVVHLADGLHSFISCRILDESKTSVEFGALLHRDLDVFYLSILAKVLSDMFVNRVEVNVP